MDISKREKIMIELLLNQESGVKLDLLAEALDVSNRTVYREIGNLENTLKSYEITLTRDLDKGYRLVGKSKYFKKLQEELNYIPKELSIQQRQSLLVIQLLLSEEEIKMKALALNLQVSVGTIQSDLIEINEVFKEYKIEIQKIKSKGIKAVAKESNRRLIVAGLISSEINEYYFSQLLNDFEKENHDSFWNKNENIFLGLLDKKILADTYSVLKEYNQELFAKATDIRLQRFIILLTFSITRMKNGKYIKKNDKLTESSENFTNIENAKIIFDKIKKTQAIEVTKEEINFFSYQLEGLNINLQKDFFADDYDANLSFKVGELISDVSNKMEWDFNQDKSLYDDLLMHISAAVKRALAPMPANTDSLLQKIHSQYKELSLVVEDSLKEVFAGVDFLFEEVIYIVLHFASTYEKIIARKNISVLVICSSGIGMAKILKNRLQKNVLEISSITTARVSELDRLNLEGYDLILSTVFLEGFELDYQLVTPLLLDDEINSIRMSIQELNKQSTPTSICLEQSTDENNFKDHYGKMAMVNQLLEEFSLKQWDDYRNLDELIDSICVYLEKRLILSNPKKIKDKLLNRMETAPIGIPNTNMALFHCIDSEIQQPYFGVYDIPKSFEMRSFDKEKIKMNRVLLMIGPDPLSESAQEVLGIISSNIVESDLNLEIFNTSTEIMMSKYLNILFLENYKK